MALISGLIWKRNLISLGQIGVATKADFDAQTDKWHSALTNTLNSQTAWINNIEKAAATGGADALAAASLVDVEKVVSGIMDSLPGSFSVQAFDADQLAKDLMRENKVSPLSVDFMDLMNYADTSFDISTVSEFGTSGATAGFDNMMSEFDKASQLMSNIRLFDTLDKTITSYIKMISASDEQTRTSFANTLTDDQFTKNGEKWTRRAIVDATVWGDEWDTQVVPDYKSFTYDEFTYNLTTDGGAFSVDKLKTMSGSEVDALVMAANFQLQKKFDTLMTGTIDDVDSFSWHVGETPTEYNDKGNLVMSSGSGQSELVMGAMIQNDIQKQRGEAAANAFFLSKPLWDSDSDNDGEKDGFFGAPSLKTIASIAITVAGGGPWLQFALNSFDTMGNVAKGNMSFEDGLTSVAKGAVTSSFGGGFWNSVASSAITTGIDVARGDMSWQDGLINVGKGAAISGVAAGASALGGLAGSGVNGLGLGGVTANVVSGVATSAINTYASAAINSFQFGGANGGDWFNNDSFKSQTANAFQSMAQAGITSLASGIVKSARGATWGKGGLGFAGQTRDYQKNAHNLAGAIGGLAGQIFSASTGNGFSLSFNNSTNNDGFSMTFGGANSGFSMGSRGVSMQQLAAGYKAADYFNNDNEGSAPAPRPEPVHAAVRVGSQAILGKRDEQGTTSEGMSTAQLTPAMLAAAGGFRQSLIDGYQGSEIDKASYANMMMDKMGSNFQKMVLGGGVDSALKKTSMTINFMKNFDSKSKKGNYLGVLSHSMQNVNNIGESITKYHDYKSLKIGETMSSWYKGAVQKQGYKRDAVSYTKDNWKYGERSFDKGNMADDFNFGIDIESMEKKVWQNLSGLSKWGKSYVQQQASNHFKKIAKASQKATGGFSISGYSDKEISQRGKQANAYLKKKYGYSSSLSDGMLGLYEVGMSEQLLSNMKKNVLGVEYVWGGGHPEWKTKDLDDYRAGLDCSGGNLSQMRDNMGLSGLNRIGGATDWQVNNFPMVDVKSPKDKQPGDFTYYLIRKKDREAGKQIYEHVNVSERNGYVYNAWEENYKDDPKNTRHGNKRLSYTAVDNSYINGRNRLRRIKRPIWSAMYLKYGK